MTRPRRKNSSLVARTGLDSDATSFGLACGEGRGLEQGNSTGRRRRPWRSRVSTGHVVMVLAGLIGALLTLTALRAADHTTPMLAAARDIAPGTAIDARALRVARVHADAATLATLIAPDQLDAVRGWVAVEDIPAGSLLTP